MAPPDLSTAAALPFAEPAEAPDPRRFRTPRRAPVDVAAVIDDLHARHGAELLRFCRWMLHDADDAADALQDTWIRAMSALGEDRIRVTALRPWLYAIARNVCLDRLRDRKRRSLQDLDESVAGGTPGADEIVALRHEASAALALVGALSERQRSALLMRELAGMSVPDIAEALGLTVDRAAWAIADARRAVEEARAGVDMACEDARARLASGHRGRTLRAHLGRCTACCAHDRKLRAKRVLAPALLPLLWLRRLTLPLFANPAAAATLVVAVGATAVAPHAGGHPVPVRRHAAAAPTAHRVPHRTARPHAQPAAKAISWDRPVRHAPARPQAARHAAPLPPAATTAPPPTAQASPAAPRPAPVSRIVANATAPVRHVVAAATAPVRRVVSAAATDTAAAVPAARPVVDRVAATATGVLDRLG